MTDDVEKTNLVFEQALGSFKLQNLKDSQQEALQNLVKGQDVFIIQPTGSGKSLRHRQGQRFRRSLIGKDQRPDPRDGRN